MNFLWCVFSRYRVLPILSVRFRSPYWSVTKPKPPSPFFCCRFFHHLWTNLKESQFCCYKTNRKVQDCCAVPDYMTYNVQRMLLCYMFYYMVATSQGYPWKNCWVLENSLKITFSLKTPWISRNSTGILLKRPWVLKLQPYKSFWKGMY